MPAAGFHRQRSAAHGRGPGQAGRHLAGADAAGVDRKPHGRRRRRCDWNWIASAAANGRAPCAITAACGTSRPSGCSTNSPPCWSDKRPRRHRMSMGNADHQPSTIAIRSGAAVWPAAGRRRPDVAGRPLPGAVAGGWDCRPSRPSCSSPGGRCLRVLKDRENWYFPPPPAAASPGAVPEKAPRPHLVDARAGEAQRRAPAPRRRGSRPAMPARFPPWGSR